MGDRCNIVVRSQAIEPAATLKNVLAHDAVVFYGHWSGESMPQQLQQALAKRWRWSDSAYLARIIFDEFTRGSTGKETGFGISTGLCDNGRPVMVVDVAGQRVRMFAKSGKQLYAWSFEEYVETPIATIMAIYEG